MKSLWLKTGAITLTAMWSVAALAQSSSSTVSANPALSGTSTATAEAAAPKKSAPLPITVTTLETLYGPPVTNLGQHYSSDDSIDSRQDLALRTQGGPNYKLDAKTTISAVADFMYVMANAANDPTHEGVQWNDSFMKLSRAGLYEANIMGNKFALDGDARYYAPTAHASILNNKKGALRVSLNPSMQIGKSRWSLSMVNFGKYQLQTRDYDVDSGSPLTQFELYTGPQINYEISDKITAFVLYEVDGKWNTLGQPNYTAYAKSNTDLEPGVLLNLHERFQLIPILNWYTNQPLDTTSIQVMASVKLY